MDYCNTLAVSVRRRCYLLNNIAVRVAYRSRKAGRYRRLRYAIILYN